MKSRKTTTTAALVNLLQVSKRMDGPGEMFQKGKASSCNPPVTSFIGSFLLDAGVSC